MVYRTRYLSPPPLPGSDKEKVFQKEGRKTGDIETTGALSCTCPGDGTMNPPGAKKKNVMHDAFLPAKGPRAVFPPLEKTKEGAPTKQAPLYRCFCSHILFLCRGIIRTPKVVTAMLARLLLHIPHGPRPRQLLPANLQHTKPLADAAHPRWPLVERFLVALLHHLRDITVLA